MLCKQKKQTAECLQIRLLFRSAGNAHNVTVSIVDSRSDVLDQVGLEG